MERKAKKDREATNTSGQEEINNRLLKAIDGLRKDVTRVEIWATALGSFSKPVPDYSPSKKFELGNAQGAGTANYSAKKRRRSTS